MLNNAVSVPVSTRYGNGILESLHIQPDGLLYAKIKMENGIWINFVVMSHADFFSNVESIKKA